MKDLIVVKQLPIIEQQLKELSAEIDKKVETANALVCNDDTVKEVKKLRTQFNNDFKELEAQRKYVKEQVLAPYNKFEEVYKTCVSEKYKEADATLKTKIDLVENQIKKETEDELRDLFTEYSESKSIDFVTYESANINVTLSASKKSLKEQVKTFVDKIADDLVLIDTQEHKAEILVEYKTTLNVASAITNVTKRFKAIEEEKKRQEELARIKEQEQQVIAKVEAVEAPEVITNIITPNEEPIMEVTPEPVQEQQPQIFVVKFQVEGTREKIVALRDYMKEMNIKYDSIN